MPVDADIRNIEKVGRGTARKGGRVSPNEDLRWWLADEDHLHERVWSVAERIRQNLSRRRVQSYTYALMYNQVDAWDLYGAVDSLGSGLDNGRITLNVVQNAIDTASSMIAKNRPAALFLTDGEDYDTRMKGEDLTRYVAGVYEDADIHALSERAFTDGAIFGLGGLKFYADEDTARVCCELVAQHEILVDELDGIAEDPRQLHQRKYMSRDVLIEKYPDLEDEILAARSDFRSQAVKQTVGDLIPVVESWHRRSGPRATDGLHTIVIEGATLLSEPYDKDYFPILFWRWYHRTSGFWGRGIAQEIGKIQRTINKILSTIDESQDLMGVPCWFASTGTVANWDQLASNEIGRIVEYTGTPPTPALPPAATPELYQHVWNLVDRSYQIVGVSQGMAEGNKPPGVESAAAVREVADIASGRFQVVGQRWERFHIAISKIVVDLSRDLFAGNKKLEIKVKEEEQLRTIKWVDVDMDRDRFKISVFPVSSLPSTPQGRISTITEWMQAGWLTKEEAMSLLQIPDLQSYSSRETSTLDLVEQTIGEIKRFGRYTPEQKPIGQMNLSLAQQLAIMEKVVAKKQKLPDSVLSLLDLYLDDISMLMKQQAPPPPAPPPGPPGAPPGSPAMPVGAPLPPMPAMASAA